MRLSLLDSSFIKRLRSDGLKTVIEYPQKRYISQYQMGEKEDKCYYHQYQAYPEKDAEETIHISVEKAFDPGNNASFFHRGRNYHKIPVNIRKFGITPVIDLF